MGLQEVYMDLIVATMPMFDALKYFLVCGKNPFQIGRGEKN